jgi:hypothetical protein
LFLQIHLVTLFGNRVGKFYLVQHTKTSKNIPIDHKIYRYVPLQGPKSKVKVGIFGMKIPILSGNPAGLKFKRCAVVSAKPCLQPGGLPAHLRRRLRPEIQPGIDSMKHHFGQKVFGQNISGQSFLTKYFRTKSFRQII